MRYEDGVLKVLANCFLSRKRLKQIIYDNSQWIKERQQREQTVENRNENATERRKNNNGDFQNALSHVYSARKTIFMGDVIDVAASVSTKTYLEDGTLYVPEKYYQNKELRIKAVKSYLKKMATLYVSTEIADFGSGISLCPVKIEFKDIAGSWLKCSLASQRVLTIDYRIVQLPQRLRLYVIAHAFAHFSHPTHDDGFWNFMSNVLPRYQDCAHQLEQFNFLLDI